MRRGKQVALLERDDLTEAAILRASFAAAPVTAGAGG
jgi:hypothetical protein